MRCIYNYNDTAACNYMRNGDKGPHCPLLPSTLTQPRKKDSFLLLDKIIMNIVVINIIIHVFNAILMVGGAHLVRN